MTQDDADRVSTPAMLLIVTGVLLLAVDLFSGALSLFGLISPFFQVFATAMQIANNAETEVIVMGVVQVILGFVFAISRLLCTGLGLAASAATIVAGQRLMQFRTRNIVTAGAVLAAVQPIAWVVTGCFTSGCGLCGPVLYLPLAMFGSIAMILAMQVLRDLGPFPDDDPA